MKAAGLSAALLLGALAAAGGGAGAALAAERQAAGVRPDSSRLAGRLQALLDSLVAGEPGVRSGVLLVAGPAFRWQGASGVAVAATKSAILPDDQFVIDSMAKPMTASLVLKLVEAGELALDDRIAAYLPESLLTGLHVYEGRSYGGEITVRQLLNHTSGIVDDWVCPGFVDSITAAPQRRWRPEETIAFVKERCPPRFRPGAGFHYSDTAYNLLGLILEKVTGEPLHRAYRRLLLDPLGMSHTYRPAYEDARPSRPGRPPAERYLGDIECALWPAVMTADWAGGGLVSTTEDLERFLGALARNEVFRDPATRDTMFAWVESGPMNNYGLGISRVLFSRSTDPGHAGLGEVWGHSGSSHNFMYYWPAEQVLLIGTLNQMEVETGLYDTVARVMRALRASD